MADVCDRCKGRGVIWDGQKEQRCRGVWHRAERAEPIPLSEEQWLRYLARHRAAHP